MKKENIEQFLITWGIVLFINQLFIFGGCFNPACIGAALPHTGVIAWFITLFYKKDDDEDTHDIPDITIKPDQWEQRTTRRSPRPSPSFKTKRKEPKREPHPNWDNQYIHKQTRVEYSKFEFDINGWSTQKLYLPYNKTFEYINIYTGDKYNRAKVDYYGNKKAPLKTNLNKKPNENKQQNRYKQTHKKEESFTKKFGDDYEKYIGKKFEDKGDVVIYNGFLKGYEDMGVDIIAISEQAKTIDLIQCKNWVRKEMVLDDIKNIHHKLSVYNFDFFDLSSYDINAHLTKTHNEVFVKNLLSRIQYNPKSYKIRKILYASSDKVIDLEIGKFLIYIKPNIFRYEDMKIVIHKPKTFN